MHSSSFTGPSSIGVDVNFLNFEDVYGIPEHADAFSLKSTQ
jgi:alpha 1,3-glucosidase